MNTEKVSKNLGIVALAVGVLTLSTPALAQRGSGRSRGDGGSPTRVESRSGGSTESRTESRSESRTESRPPSRGSVQTPTRPATPSPNTGGWRGGSGSQTTPSPAVPRPTAPPLSPRSTASGGRFGAGPVANPARPQTPVNTNSGAVTNRERGEGGTTTWNRPGSTPSGTVTRPNDANATRPGGTVTRPGAVNGNTGATGRWERPGSVSSGSGPATGTNPPAVNRPGGFTRPGATQNPAGIPPRGETNVGRPGAAVPPIASWRPPDRTRPGTSGQALRPGSSATRPGAVNGNRPGAITGNRPTTTPRYVGVTPSNRPPAVDRSRWLDPNRSGFGGRNWDIVPQGYFDPWARYHTTSPRFINVNFYYPYYYIGPYYSGFYYSPFHVYAGWFPTYIYPERVIYVERRVYLRDYISDSDYYDPFGMDVQSSLTASMEDIKSAWLYGDGGRLLQHINAAVPVRIYQKGVYKYSLEPEDYRDVTKDALNRVDTVGFEWVNVDKRRSDEVALTARHTFRDPDGDRHVIRLTYTLEKARGAWWITESGTSAWTGDI